MPPAGPRRCLFCNATGVTKAHVFAKSWTAFFDDPDDPLAHEVVHRYSAPGPTPCRSSSGPRRSH